MVDILPTFMILSGTLTLYFGVAAHRVQQRRARSPERLQPIFPTSNLSTLFQEWFNTIDVELGPFADQIDIDVIRNILHYLSALRGGIQLVHLVVSSSSIRDSNVDRQVQRWICSRFHDCDVDYTFRDDQHDYHIVSHFRGNGRSTALKTPLAAVQDPNLMESIRSLPILRELNIISFPWVLKPRAALRVLLQPTGIPVVNLETLSVPVNALSNVAMAALRQS